MQYVHISSPLLDILPKAADSKRSGMHEKESRPDLLTHTHRRVLDLAERVFFVGLCVGVAGMLYGFSGLVHF